DQVRLDLLGRGGDHLFGCHVAVEHALHVVAEVVHGAVPPGGDRGAAGDLRSGFGGDGPQVLVAERLDRFEERRGGVGGGLVGRDRGVQSGGVGGVRSPDGGVAD